jgi:hypothetical protein
LNGRRDSFRRRIDVIVGEGFILLLHRHFLLSSKSKIGTKGSFQKRKEIPDGKGRETTFPKKAMRDIREPLDRE